MKENNRNEIAADAGYGVYVCENSAANNEGESGIILYDMDFYNSLSEDFEGTIYGNVSDEVLQMIIDEYGVH